MVANGTMQVTGTITIEELAKPQPPTTNGGPWRGFNAVYALTESAVLGSSDFGALITLSGEDQELTLNSASLVAGDVAGTTYVINVGPGDWAITATTGGINQEETASFTLVKDQGAWITLAGLEEAPHWVATFGDRVNLAANQVAVVDPTGVDFEGRTDKRPWVGSVMITADGTYDVGYWPDLPATLPGSKAIRLGTSGGACSVEWLVNGTPMNGFEAPVDLTEEPVDANSTQALAENDRIQIVVTGASGLAGVVWAFKTVRTGN